MNQLYYVILVTVISSLSTMFLAFQYQKEMNKDNESKIKVIHVFITSILMGALGSLCAIYIFDYQKENKKFVLSQIILAIIQVVLIIIISTYVT